MKPASEKFAIVLVTAPKIKVARKLARAALAARLVACANLMPKIESHYRWRGKVESAREVLLVMKTTRPKIEKLWELIQEKHPYDTPEFLVLPVTGGSAKYLTWLNESIA